MIVDASVLLRAFFPDEAQTQAQALVRQHVAGRITLKAPRLLVYEFSNAVWQAERRERIAPAQVNEIIQAVIGLDIHLVEQDWGEMLDVARAFNLSAYDAAYLSLAQKMGETLITGDERLFQAANTPGKVLWINDYPV